MYITFLSYIVEYSIDIRRPLLLQIINKSKINDDFIWPTYTTVSCLRPTFAKPNVKLIKQYSQAGIAFHFRLNFNGTKSF